MNANGQASLEELIQSSRILVTLGSGGVGKTTSSIAMAMLAARQGKRVGLLSIDPAKRLADALGIPLGSELRPVHLGQSISGSLEAAMLDQKAVFDDMVRRFASSPALQEKIFQNSIYKEVSANLGGPLEYMALAKLESMLSQDRYDLIVLDTPPDTHALDFLSRPNILSGFIENGVMSWMIKPFHIAQKLGAGAIFKAGGRLMNGISSVTGVKMLRLLAEFLVLMEDVIIGFNRVGREVAESLKKSTTGFVLVSAPYNNAVRSAGHLMKELQAQQYPLLAIILNRNIPFALQESVQAWSEWKEAPADLKAGFTILERRQRYAMNLADQLLHRAETLFERKTPLFMIEEQSQMIHTETSLWQFVDALSQGRVRQAGEKSHI